MQPSNLGYRPWLVAIYLFNSEPKGITSVRLAHYLGISQPVAWHLLHRIRESFRTGAPMLRGTVEVDETFVGGKQRNRHRVKRRLYSGENQWGKQPAVGAVQRDGPVVVSVIDTPNAKRSRASSSATSATVAGPTRTTTGATGPDGVLPPPNREALPRRVGETP